MRVSGDRAALAVVGVICVAAMVIARRARPGVAVLLAVVASFFASLALKDLFHVPRPTGELSLVYASGWSFPSTDAAITSAAAAALYATVTWTAPAVRRRLGCVLALGVAVVGFLVVYLGAHWPSDVLAGWCLGGTLGAGTAYLGHRVLPPPKAG